MSEKLSKDDVQRIIEEQMPNFKVAQTAEGPPADADAPGKTRAKPEAHTPDAKTLRNKYLREKFIEGTNPGPVEELQADGPAVVDATDDDEQIVMVEPKKSPHPLDRGSRPKAVVISKKTKKIVGSQG